jgi:hypothetical protein
LGLIPESPGVIQAFHFREEQFSHFGEFVLVFRVLGEIDLVGQSLGTRQAVDIGLMVFVEEFEWIFVQVE